MVFRLLLAVAWLAVPGSRLLAQSVTSPYSLAVFAAEAGLPGHEISDIEQTADGYLWVTTNAGLARFDGHRFTVFGEEATGIALPTAFHSLYRSADGTLFATTWDSQNLRSADGDLVYSPQGRVLRYVDGRVLRYADGRFSLVADGDPDLAEAVSDAAGQLWRRWGLDLYHQEHARAAGQPLRLYLDEDSERPGSSWTKPGVGGPLGVDSVRTWEVAVPDGIVPFRFSPSPDLIPYPDRDERLEAVRVGSEVALTSLVGERRGRFALPETACPLLLSRDNVLWSVDGPSLVAHASEVPTPVARFEIGLLGADFPRSCRLPAFEDREGTLWVGTSAQGLVRIRRDLFQVYSTTDVAGGDVIASISPGADGSVLLRNQTAQVYRARGQGVEPVRIGDAPLLVDGMSESADDAWLFSAFETGKTLQLMRWAEGRLAPVFTYADPGGTLGHHFYPDPTRADVLWLHTSDAVFRITDPTAPDPEVEVVLEDLPLVRHLLVDREDVLWVGTEEGLVRLDGDERTLLTQTDGLPNDHVRYVHQDPSGGLWVGTYGGGLARYRDGRFQAVSEADGLGEDVVSSILEDDAGHFWMSGNQSVHRATRADLNAFLDGTLTAVPSVRYGREAGLVNAEGSGVPALKAPDGRMWFPTFQGAAVLDPTEAHGWRPPLAHVAALLVGDERIVARDGKAIRLGAEQRRFTVEYIGLGLRYPEFVTYRYQLDGLDLGWVEAGTERRATYTNVSPGDYTFRVQARMADGAWSETGGTLALTVAPFFYETRWFLLLCVLAAAGLVLGVLRWRLRQAGQREAELNALVQARTADLAAEKETVAEQAAELRTLDEAKSRLFANVSHEFRTPLQLILGPLSDVAEGRHGAVPEGVRDQVRLATRNGRRLLALVEQLLTIARSDAGELTIDPIRLDAADFAARLAEAFHPLAERDGITFETDLRPAVGTFDPVAVETALANLLANAFSFTPAGGTVRLILSPGNPLRFQVSDTGPGIAPHQAAHVFDRFYQADASSTRRQPGTGIGLALVREIADLHGGTASVESTPGHGATFTLTLPIHPEVPTVEVTPELRTAALLAASGDGASADGQHKSPPLPPEAPDDTPRVLVVDDNADLRALVRRHLDARYVVEEADDGEAALALAQARVPDAIVSDVMMPRLDGLGLVRALRADPETDFVPVLLLTARAAVSDTVDGLGAGADDYLAKPFAPAELRARVDALIAGRQRLRERWQGTVPEADPLPVRLAPEATAEQRALVEQLVAVVDERLDDEDLSVDALAEALGMSRATLYRRLKGALDGTPADLLREVRLARAAALLAAGAGTVSEVAYAVGFKSVSHFAARFRERYGATPSAHTRTATSR